MEEEQLAQLHNDLVNGKSRRGKFGGIGAGEKYSKLLDGPKKHMNEAELKRLPDRPLYNRFVMASKKELCRQTVLSVLEHNGGEMRWDELIALVAKECGEAPTKEFKIRVLVNIPESCLSDDTPIVRIRK